MAVGVVLAVVGSQPRCFRAGVIVKTLSICHHDALPEIF